MIIYIYTGNMKGQTNVEAGITSKIVRIMEAMRVYQVKKKKKKTKE